MNKIFIEAESNKTSEYQFVRTILSVFFPDKEVEIIPMGGVSNLFSETIINQILEAKLLQKQVIVLIDADTRDKDWGYVKRKKDIEDNLSRHGISFPFFLYPNNYEDGDVEVLMESVARRDLHSVFFDCFEDYEKCILGVRDPNGHPLYNTPNLKGKLHTYITAQKLSNKKRKKLGQGEWLFDDANLWDLKKESLKPLILFLKNYLI